MFNNINIPKKLKKNFKLPILLVILAIVICIINKIFNIFKAFKIANNTDYAMIFIAITTLFFTAIVFKNVRDILSLLFGQKGQNSLTDIAKK